MSWAANFATAVELSRDFINLVLSKLLQVLQARGEHRRSGSLGIFGTYEAELTGMTVTDLEDPGAPGGGVLTDLEVRGALQFRLFRFIPIRSQALFALEDVSLDFTATQAGLPKGIAIAISPSLAVKISFPNAGFLVRWFLNGVVGPLVALGIWLAFRVVRKVEIPVWDLVDVFAAIGLRFAPGSPLLTAQKAVAPHSLLAASGFNLTNPLVGDPAQLRSFLPAQTNIGAVVHERVVAAGVEMAFSKGWIPNRFRAGGWKIYINSVSVQFEQDKIVAAGSLKAKRGSCWCRVRARIRFRVAVAPKIINTQGPNPQPTAVFSYDADINTQISTSGMLAVLGAIMLGPLFMGLTIAMSVLVNIVLDRFLPFTCTFPIQGGYLTATVRSVNFSGLLPFYVRFPLQLSGQGVFDLAPFQQYQLPGGVPIQTGFTDETISVQAEELRVAVGLS